MKATTISNLGQLLKSLEYKKRSRREVSITSSDFLHLFEIMLDRLIQLLLERLGKLLFGLGGDLLVLLSITLFATASTRSRRCMRKS